jgi:hypothetical protein
MGTLYALPLTLTTTIACSKDTPQLEYKLLDKALRVSGMGGEGGLMHLTATVAKIKLHY